MRVNLGGKAQRSHAVVWTRSHALLSQVRVGVPGGWEDILRMRNLFMLPFILGSGLGSRAYGAVACEVVR